MPVRKREEIQEVLWKRILKKKKTSSNIQPPDVFRRGEKLHKLNIVIGYSLIPALAEKLIASLVPIKFTHLPRKGSVFSAIIRSDTCLSVKLRRLGGGKIAKYVKRWQKNLFIVNH